MKPQRRLTLQKKFVALSVLFIVLFVSLAIPVGVYMYYAQRHYTRAINQSIAIEKTALRASVAAYRANIQLFQIALRGRSATKAELASHLDRFNTSVQQFRMFNNALTWGSTTQAFKDADEGTGYRKWKSLGLDKSFEIVGVPKSVSRLATNADTYFEGMIKHSQRTLGLLRRAMTLERENRLKEAQSLRQETVTDVARAEYYQNMMGQYFGQLLDATNQHNNHLVKDVTAMHRYFVLAIAIAILILFVLYMLILTLFARRSLVSPIQRLIKAMQAVGLAKFDTKVEINSRDELGTMGSLFNQMTTDLRQKTVGKAYLDHIIATVPNFLFILEPCATISEVNDTSLDVLGYRRDELIGQPINMLVKIEKKKGNTVRALVCNRTISNQELILRCKNAEFIPVLFSVSRIKDEQGALESIVCSAQDISERKRNEAKLEEFAHYDPLTTLPNRRHFEKMIHTFLSKASRHKTIFAIIMLDLDNFKDIDDTLGHQVGDQLLQYVANSIVSLLRAEDYIARWGGDEFAIILDNIDDEEYAGIVAERITKLLSQPVNISGNRVRTRLSMGIACYPVSARDVEGLIRNADIAMYREKELGSHSYQFFTEEINHESS